MKINSHMGSADIKIDTKRIDRNIREAQKRLNEDVLNDTTPYVPKGGTGYLRGSGQIPDPYGGEVVWDANYSHFQYVGFVRTDENGRIWVGKNEQKPILTNQPLTYQEPGATSEWFKESKKNNLDTWIKHVKEEIGKG